MTKLDFNINKIVVKSRIRLARNFEHIPFENVCFEKCAMILKNVFTSIKNLDNFEIYLLKDLNKIQQGVLFEKNLISAKLIDNAMFSSVILSKDEKTSIMILEEDHIRLQVFENGFCLDELHYKIIKLDDYICKYNQIAIDKNLGFITSCITNCGTGLRASCKMFLPGICLNDKLDKLNEMVGESFNLRGFYGEGFKPLGFYFQLSNSLSQIKNNYDIIDEVKNIVFLISEFEFKQRIFLINNKKDFLISKIKNSIKILSFSKQIDFVDFLTNLGLVKLGCDLKLIAVDNAIILDDLLVLCQNASLQNIASKKFDKLACDRFRAKYLSKILKNIIHFL